ncbi:NAD(P)H-dependent oxidoreductase [Neisseria perflava]|uniref:NAD(P)H-dependent oxidoreductase n=1 Tax=Neisseria perflava TaxID=33053 RepID=UPI0020A1F4CB|nr:NAD(P)H-dependent oxidoreductase [Neisseria perflava]MCP1661250.1 putative NADPH-quinone reductase [Neisseria perflava]MCP1772260.1 putative NADPH-quinone reductase [Neisseria perflava]
MSNILIVSGHTDLNNSFANKIILEKLEKDLPNAEFDYLDKLYPNYQFDVAAEQAKLVNADIIVLQFPIFWYAVPSLIKKWIEDVFVHGFSHGSTGNKLHGKKIVASFTTGAPEEMYVEGGIQGYPIEAFLPPLKQTAKLTGLEWAGHVYTGGVSYTSRSDESKLAAMKAKSEAHADRLVKLLNIL